MIRVLQTAAEIQQFCDAHGWESCLIGGVAVQRWAEPRVTRDVDVALLTGFGGEELFIDALLAKYPARRPDAKIFALKNRVLLLQTPDGLGIDISLAALPFEEEAIRRATLFSFGPASTPAPAPPKTSSCSSSSPRAPSTSTTPKALSSATARHSTGTTSSATSAPSPKPRKLPKSWTSLPAFATPETVRRLSTSLNGGPK